jgi:hypothetical protein
VKIADDVSSSVTAIEESLAARGDGVDWLAQVDDFLARISWDQTFRAMWQLIETAGEPRTMRKPVRATLRPVLPGAAPLSGGGIPVSPTS